jgi:hypothetical protein
MPRNTNKPPVSYLLPILSDGARPYLYRNRVRQLLGVPEHGEGGMAFAPMVPPVGFRYRFMHGPEAYSPSPPQSQYPGSAGQTRRQEHKYQFEYENEYENEIENEIENEYENEIENKIENEYENEYEAGHQTPFMDEARFFHPQEPPADTTVTTVTPGETPHTSLPGKPLRLYREKPPADTITLETPAKATTQTAAAPKPKGTIDAKEPTTIAKGTIRTTETIGPISPVDIPGVSANPVSFPVLSSAQAPPTNKQDTPPSSMAPPEPPVNPEMERVQRLNRIHTHASTPTANAKAGKAGSGSPSNPAPVEAEAEDEPTAVAPVQKPEPIPPRIIPLQSMAERQGAVGGAAFWERSGFNRFFLQGSR